MNANRIGMRVSRRFIYRDSRRWMRARSLHQLPRARVCIALRCFPNIYIAYRMQLKENKRAGISLKRTYA